MIRKTSNLVNVNNRYSEYNSPHFSPFVISIGIIETDLEILREHFCTFISQIVKNNFTKKE